MTTKNKDVSTRKMKPTMPQDKPKLFLPQISARLMHDFDRYSNGSMAMTMADIGGEITDAGTGEKIGSIYGALGGGIVITIGRVAWSVNMKDLFAACLKAHKEQYK